MCVPLKVEENYNGGGIAESLPAFCIVHSSFCLPSCLHARCLDGYGPEGPWIYPGGYPMWIAKTPLFAALFECVPHSALLLLHSLRIPSELNTAVRSADPRSEEHTSELQSL